MIYFFQTSPTSIFFIIFDNFDPFCDIFEEIFEKLMKRKDTNIDTTGVSRENPQGGGVFF